MTFNTPSSFDELLSDMELIDIHYRKRQDSYEELTLDPISLERITYTPVSDNALLEKATEMAGDIVNQKKEEYIEDCTFQKNILEAKNTALLEDLNYKLGNLEEKYVECKAKYQADATKRGLINSSAYINGVAEIEQNQNNETIKLNAEYNLKKSYNDGEITAYETKISNSTSRFSNEKEYQIKKIFIDLKKEEYNRSYEVEKYNNSQDEKEQKTNNSLKSSKMSLKLNYIKIIETSMTDDELILCGYYKDMIKIADSYFYSINAVTAYTLFSENSIFIYYLGSFYNQINQKYLVRKNNAS